MAELSPHLLSAQIDREAAEGTAVVRLDGELDLATSEVFTGIVEALIDNGATHIDIDARQLRFIDAAGVRVLLGLEARLVAGTIRLSHPQPVVLRVLDLCGLTRLIV